MDKTAAPVSFARPLLALLLAAALSAPKAAPVEAVKPEWRTPYDLYLTPREAWRMKTDAGDTLLFGPESRGLPPEILESLPADNKLRIPMAMQSRSLNLSNAVAIAVYEAWRQLGFGNR